jgi:hypothetical protein
MEDLKDKMEEASQVYRTLKLMLEISDLRFEKYDDELVLRCGFDTDTQPVDLTIYVRAKEQVILTLSHIPCKFSDDKRVEGAIATSLVNYDLSEGSFDYNFLDGEIRFKHSLTFCGMTILPEFVSHLLQYSVETVNKYRDLFCKLADAEITLNKFLEQIITL